MEKSNLFHTRFVCLFFVLSLIFSSCSFLNNEKEIIRIGVFGVDYEIFQYDVLKKDLENRFDVKIDFVDILTYMYTQQFPEYYDAYDESLRILLDDEKVDILLGIPSYQLYSMIDEERLLDITDEINTLSKLHKGVVNRSRGMGNGKLYYISPIFYNVYLLLQNREILDSLNIDVLPSYANWNEFLYVLNEVKNVINEEMNRSALALVVKNEYDDKLFIGYEFIMQLYGVGGIVRENYINEKGIHLYEIYSEIVAKHGSDIKDFEGMPKNWIFSNGEYAFMMADSYDVEVFFNKAFNEQWNTESPFDLKIDFPVDISYISYDNTKTQNFQDSSISINRNSENKELSIQIMNYLIGKEYANKIIDTRSNYSHFASFAFTYPTFYDSDTITELNKSYGDNFDVSFLYNIDYGIPLPEKPEVEKLANIFNDNFTEIFKVRDSNFLMDEINRTKMNIIQQPMTIRVSASDRATQTNQNPSLENHMRIYNELAESYGIFELNPNAEYYPMIDLFQNYQPSDEFLMLYPTEDEWRMYLLETAVPIWANYPEYVPGDEDCFNNKNHDVAIVKFLSNEIIDVYFNGEIIDFKEATPYAVQIGNHDEVMLPMEIIFEKADISYLWDEESNILYLFDLIDEIILEPGRAGFSINVNDYIWDDDSINGSIPVFLERKDNELYILSSLLDLIIKENSDTDDFNNSSAYNPLTPLIYHDLNIVILATDDEIQKPLFHNKRVSMLHQFTRVDTPLTEPLPIFLNHVEGTFDYEEIMYKKGIPFIIRTHRDDYIMMPLLETLEILGIESFLIEHENHYTLTISENDLVIHNGVPLFQSNDYHFYHEVPPMLVDDVFYISHIDLTKIIPQYGYYFFINYDENSLYINH